MSVGILFMILVIVFAIYFYMRHIFRKRSRAMEEIDTVQYYRNNYPQSGAYRKRRRSRQTDHENGYKTYVTKYNSTEDYRERKGL